MGRKKGELKEEMFFLFQVMPDGHTKLLGPPSTSFRFIKEMLEAAVRLGREAEIHSTWLASDLQKKWVVGDLYPGTPLSF